MKLFHLLALTAILILFVLWACRKEAAPLTYDQYPVYEGSDLGLTYAPERSVFRLWSPPAEEVRLHLYEAGLGGAPLETRNMTQGENGVWEVAFDEDLKGKYYSFQVRIGRDWLGEVPDPYAKAVGTNGKRGMVVDPEETDPEGWEQDQRVPTPHPNNIIIWELHIRDLSMHDNSGIQNKGKFLGLTETGTVSPEGLKTGLDHIKELGVTHVHLLPSFDFMSIDETKPDDNQFNWGYDPQNYNVPEGSYSTNPEDGAVRIREFKQLVKALHDNGIGVIMDVVYNHTGATEESNFNQLVPGYYYRQDSTGVFSNASACGNETASERPMMRKFIKESVAYWAKEYHIDGFRFDLMGIHDIETMNQVSATLHAIDPRIFIYGEGWTAGDSPLPYEQRALKRFTHRLEGVAAFSDNIRDGIKGHVFTHEDKGFASGKPGMEETVKFGIVASTQHPQVDYTKVQWLDAPEPWAKEPFQTITYVSCHDNHTLWDRLINSSPEVSEQERIQMHKLAGAIVLTSQGVAFLHAGVEMLRTKNGVENSFNSPDSINRLDWSRKARYKPVFDYYQGLIRLRKNHPAFRMPSAAMIQQHLRFLEPADDNLIAYTISGNANGDSWKEILVAFNGNISPKTIDIPEGNWTIVANGEKIDEKGMGRVSNGKLTVSASSAVILVKS